MTTYDQGFIKTDLCAPDAQNFKAITAQGDGGDVFYFDDVEFTDQFKGG